MRIELYNTDHSRLVSVFPFYGEYTSISVGKRKPIGKDSWEPVRINWPCIGAQDIQTTRAFAEGMLKACEIAEEMEAATGDSQ